MTWPRTEPHNLRGWTCHRLRRGPPLALNACCIYIYIHIHAYIHVCLSLYIYIYIYSLLALLEQGLLQVLLCILAEAPVEVEAEAPGCQVAAALLEALEDLQAHPGAEVALACAEVPDPAAAGAASESGEQDKA